MMKDSKLVDKISSAGLAAIPGDPPAPNSVATLGELGIDISSHKAELCDRKLLQAYDLILTMTCQQRDYVHNKFDVSVIN